MKYNSAKSVGFGVLLWGVMIILAVSVAIIPGSYRLAAAMISLIVCGFLLWIWFGTYYEFKDTYLAIRFGPFSENITYEKIFSVRPIKSMASSMALSSEMIELRHGRNYITGTTYISPADREIFMAELRNRCPNLVQKCID
jgi:hypothetical protein